MVEIHDKVSMGFEDFLNPFGQLRVGLHESPGPRHSKRERGRIIGVQLENTVQ